jgi:hypothetical protein
VLYTAIIRLKASIILAGDFEEISDAEDADENLISNDDDTPDLLERARGDLGPAVRTPAPPHQSPGTLLSQNNISKQMFIKI